MRATDVMTIGEVAERAGTAVSALRHYEAEGLICAGRDTAGRRVFPRAVLRRLAFVRAAQAVGLPLSDIRAALSGLPENQVPTDAHWRALASDWEHRLDARIEALTALKNSLDTCIGCGCLSLQKCVLANPQDISAADGTGARYLPAALRRTTRTTPPPLPGRALDEHPRSRRERR